MDLEKNFGSLGIITNKYVVLGTVNKLAGILPKKGKEEPEACLS